MSRLRAYMLVGLVALLLSCPAAAAAHRPSLSELLGSAMQVEQTGGAAAAVDAYLALLEQAADPKAAAPPSARLAATVAALDALLDASHPGSLPARIEHALAYRIPHSPDGDKLKARLAQIYEHAEGPLLRGELAGALFDLATYEGDAAAAAKWSAATGIVRQAVVIGPLAWPPLPALAQAPPTPRVGARLDAQYAAFSPFAPLAAPLPVTVREGFLPVGKTSQLDGMLMVVVDADVPRPQTIGISLSSPLAASVTVGGLVVLTRPPEVGAGTVTRYALAAVPAGRVRIVLQVAKQGVGATLRLRLNDPGRYTWLTWQVGGCGRVAPWTHNYCNHRQIRPVKHGGQS
jgi:hypothetical protein